MSDFKATPTPDDSRTYVNDERGFHLTNIVNIDVELPRIAKTLDKITDILKSHCGPQSGYAMLLDSNVASVFQPNLFTRDGIRILSGIEFMSPQERFIKDLITYVGGRVDEAAKDGTTTSMLIAASLLSKLLPYRHEILSMELSLPELNRLTEEVFAAVKKYLFEVDVIRLNDNTHDKKFTDYEGGIYLTEEDTIARERRNKLFPDVVSDDVTIHPQAGNVAFMQAMSSSGGNLELARAMKTIFDRSPKGAWQFISNYRSARETDNAFSVEIDPFDARIRCTVNTENTLNSVMNTEFIQENCDLIIHPDAMTDNDWRSMLILDYLKKVNDERGINIIIKRGCASLYMLVETLNQKRKNLISVFEYAPTHKVGGQDWAYELLALSAICGCQPLLDNKSDIKCCICRAKKVHWHDTYLDIYGVVEADDSSCIHPFFADPSKATPYYNALVEDLTKKIEMYRSSNCPDGKTLGRLVEVVNSLICIHRPTLRLGGNTHDQLANNEIVQDVQGAIMSSLVHGFVTGGVNTVRTPVHRILESLAINSDNSEAKRFKELLAKALFGALNDALLASGEGNVRAKKYLQDNFVDKNDTLDHMKYVNNLNVTGGIQDIEDYIREIDGDDTEYLSRNYPPIQPILITTELLSRIREVVMKFIFTNKIVVFGGVAIDLNNPIPEKK